MARRGAVLYRVRFSHSSFTETRVVLLSVHVRACARVSYVCMYVCMYTACRSPRLRSRSVSPVTYFASRSDMRLDIKRTGSLLGGVLAGRRPIDKIEVEIISK